MVEELTDPDRQDALAGGLEALTAALLDLKVGPFMNAIERAGHARGMRESIPIPRWATLAGPDARNLPRATSDKVPVMMDTMGAMAGEMGRDAPQLEAMARRMEGAMDKFLRRERRRRDRVVPPGGGAGWSRRCFSGTGTDLNAQTTVPRNRRPRSPCHGWTRRADSGKAANHVATLSVPSLPVQPQGSPAAEREGRRL